MTHIVIGAGVAGLAAAVELAQAGLRVTVLEAATQIGGRARTRCVEGPDGIYRLNFGPHALFPFAHRRLKELGVSVEGAAPRGGYGVARRGEVIQLPEDPFRLIGYRGLPLREKWQLARTLLEVVRCDASGFDDQTLTDWLDERRLGGTARELVRALFRVASYCEAPDEVSVGACLRQVQFASGGVRYLDGGWTTIVDGLAARAAELGVHVRTGVRVDRIVVEQGRAVGALLRDTALLPVLGIVSTLSPRATRALLGSHASPKVLAVASEARAVRAATLDVALHDVGAPRASVILGLDAPTYLSVHSTAARLAPSSGAVVHLMRYLTDGKGSPADRIELERLLDHAQPTWRHHIVDRHWSPALTVMHALVEARHGGVAGRPRAADSGVANVALAGDWIGPSRMLVDASLESAHTAVAYLHSRSPRGAQPGGAFDRLVAS